jgi:hypothetical protein
MDKNELDQATLERQAWHKLAMAKIQETLGGKEREQRAGQYRREAEKLMRSLPDDVSDRLWRRYSAGNVMS